MSEAPRHWRLKKQRYALLGERCPSCETKIFPPRDVCPGCNNSASFLNQLNGCGAIHSHTTVYEAPKGSDGSVPNKAV